jgi:hypothetical protein
LEWVLDLFASNNIRLQFQSLPLLAHTTVHKFTRAFLRLLLLLALGSISRFLCLGLLNFSSLSLARSVFNFSYLSSYGCTAKGTLLLPFLVLFYVTAGNKLVSKDISVCYCRSMLQQAGYQKVLYSMSWEDYLRNMSFETCHNIYTW